MKSEYVLPLADPQATLAVAGGKGASLARLARAGLSVPDGFHVTTAAYRQFVDENDLQPRILAALETANPAQPETLQAASRTIRDLFDQAQIPPDVAGAIAQAYAALPGKTPAVAVRSSATAEDLSDLSFAGQQETYLNVRGAEAVLDAVKRCWASLWTARAIGYRLQHGIDQSAVSLAVVVQLLVPAETAGILFTANPVNGRRDQVVISASWGLGEAVVGGLVTPDTITVDKTTGRVQERETADKQVMTVRVHGGTETQPVPETLRRAPVLSDEQAAALARLGVQVEELCGYPVDIEWAIADGELYLLQSRPITTLGETALPQIPPPSEWKGPNRRAKYMRVNIVELMPNPLTPLFATLGRRVINASMNRLMTVFFDRPGLMPEELIITINGYAYYNGEFTAKQIGQILLGSVGIMKRMFTGAEQRWRDARSRYKATVEEWQARPWRESSATEILHSVPEILGPAMEYYGALVSGIIPAAWISEGLFTVVYDRLIKRKNDPPAPTYLLGFDSTPILAEKALYDLAQWARTRAGLAEYLSRTPATQIVAQLDGQSPPDVNADDWREWQSRFRVYLQQYGATIYDLDFANPTPADDPTPVLETCKLFLRGEGSNPHARQHAAAERREQATQAMLNRLKGLRLRLFRSLVTRAQKYAPQREDGLADIGLGYPLVRQMLLEVGRRLVQAGGIAEAADVFWLVEDEVERAAAALDRGEPVSSMTDAVRQRKALWQAQKRVTPPVSLPLPPKFLRKMLPEQFGVQTDAAAHVIRGIPCSPGSVTATARVLHGPQDFLQMQPGDVLVAAITTPAWTPLFAMASAVVTDVGGPLSHGSIVAREYGIPAVLGTGIATRRIRSGQVITVDGSAGTVEILEMDDVRQRRGRQEEHVLQSLPITTLTTRDPFDWNATLTGDYLWTNMNVGEVFPATMTPATWSVWQELLRNMSLGEIPAYGSIAGRMYLNYSLTYSFLLKIKRKHERAMSVIGDALGVPPAGVEIPLIPVSWRTILFRLVPREFRNELKKNGLRKAAPEFLAMVRDRCLEVRKRIGAVQGDRLISLWSDEIRPLWHDVYLLQDKMNEELGALTRKLKAELTKLLGENEANALMTTLSSAGELASLGPLVGLTKLRSGELSREEYLRQYGHRGADENELAAPRPYEDPDWLDRELAEFDKSPVNVTEMLEKRDAEFDAVRQEVMRRLPPKKARGIERKIAAIVETNTLREATRSELTRVLDVIRAWFLRAGELSGLGDGVFFLTVDEVVAVLSGDTSPAAYIPARRQMYERCRALPPLPRWIRGRFDPFRWAADPNRRWDVFDPQASVPAAAPSTDRVIKGQPGSAGCVEGYVRRIDSPDEGNQLRPGEILVTTATNVGWTPLFPRAAAVVTDIGGSLSHAAIVARELGIPAVVGCRNATMRLKTGDRVRVDGGRGIVEILEQA